jgi:RNA polymerase sigma-70 factor, ECF subfamily
VLTVLWLKLYFHPPIVVKSRKESPLDDADADNLSKDERTPGEAGPSESCPQERGPKTEEFLRLLGAHERSLFTYVYALAPGWQDAEEVMQRLRIRIWQQFDQYEPDKPFDAWARAIAYYLVLAYRKEKSRQREFFAERILEAVSGEYEKHLERANERRDVLVGCLEKLDDHKREMVHAYYSSERQSSETLAARLSMTPNALRQSLFRIRKVLLDCVERTMRVESRG